MLAFLSVNIERQDKQDKNAGEILFHDVLLQLIADCRLTKILLRNVLFLSRRNDKVRDNLLTTTSALTLLLCNYAELICFSKRPSGVSHLFMQVFLNKTYMFNTETL